MAGPDATTGDAAASPPEPASLTALRQARQLLQQQFTEIDRLNSELIAARAAAESAMAARTQFLATMSHEIRTPLNAVIGMAGLLMDTSLTDEQRDYAGIVRSSGDHLLTVINDILDFSRLESGQILLESLPLQIEQVVEEALDLVSVRAREKSLELAYELATTVPHQLRGDAGRIRQILLNLLSNAVKFTERGEVLVSVDAQPDGAGHWRLMIAVKDTGIGIPAEAQGRLFRSFSQVDASTQRRFGGSGLGLAISRRLAQQMDGDIRLESQVGVGTTFYLTLRLEREENPTRVRWAAGAANGLKGRLVWVVDDNDTNRRILRAQLSAAGMEVRDTADPAEAVRWAERGDPCDLALLDFQMPDMDGLQLAQTLRRLRGPGLRQMLLSSVGPVVAESDMAASGLVAQLTKPVKHLALLETVRRLFDAQTATGNTTPTAALPKDLGERHPLRILVAEDNAVNTKLMQLILSRLGYRADYANNGFEAIAAVRRQPYDVVLMDVQMPEMDGITAATQITREMPPPNGPQVLALTAGVTPEEQRACHDAGMAVVLAKPMSPDRLVEALLACRVREDA